MKNIKMLAVASMISLGALSMVACQKTEPDIKIEKDIQGTGIGEYKGDVEVTPGGQTQAPTQGQVSKDPLEAGWTIGKFGYFEPPMEQRKPVIIGGEVVKGGYRYTIHDEKYGDIDIQFNETNGKRSIFKAGQSAEGRLAVFGASVKKSTSEMLQDLREGDAIADAWGK